MARKTHKRQHYVPASYLKAWCDTACPPHHTPYVWIFDKNGNNAHAKAPENIFTANDLYTVRLGDDTRDLRIETSLGLLESQFTKIRNSKFKYHRELTVEESAYLCLFVAAAQFRTIRSRDHHADQWGRVLDRMDDMAERMGRMTEEEQQRFADMALPSSEGSGITHEQVRELATNPLQHMIGSVLQSVAPVLSRMDMAIFCTDDPVGFITSDNPCVWYDPEGYRLPPIYRSPGLGMRTIEVTLPVSPRQCLFFNWQGIKGYMAAPQQIVDNLNIRHVAYCHENFVVNTNQVNYCWFHVPPLPEDAWENQQADHEQSQGDGTR
jgi:hypothetical protein